MDPTPRNNRIFYGLVVGLFVALGVVVWVNMPEAKPGDGTARRDERTAIVISARDLWNAYDSNEVAANRNYQGEPLRVYGTIESIAVDRDGIPYVDFDTPGMGVRANFNAGGSDALTSLRKGQSLTVRCIGVGRSVVVHLKDCQIT